MVCIVRAGGKVFVFTTCRELGERLSDLPYPWVAKCEGDDEETVKMRSALLDAVGGEVAFYRDGNFGPYEPDMIEEVGE